MPPPNSQKSKEKEKENAKNQIVTFISPLDDIIVFWSSVAGSG